MLKKKDALFGVTAKGYWRDIGNTDSYREAYHDIFKGRVNLKIDEPKQDFVGKDLRIGADVKLEHAAGLEGTVVIGDNSQVLGDVRIKDSVIGRNCTIEAGVKLNRCVIWDNSYVKKGAKITDSVICSNVRVGQGAVLEEGVIVADDTSIGDEAVIKADVKIWPKKTIEAGATVTSNMIWGEKWKKALFEGAIIKGLSNVELTPEFWPNWAAPTAPRFPRGASYWPAAIPIPSSRMLKRCFVGGLLSAGVNVRDMKMTSLPLVALQTEDLRRGWRGSFPSGTGRSRPCWRSFFWMVTAWIFPATWARTWSAPFSRKISAGRTIPNRELSPISTMSVIFIAKVFCGHLIANCLKKSACTVVVDFSFSPASQITAATFE